MSISELERVQILQMLKEERAEIVWLENELDKTHSTPNHRFACNYKISGHRANIRRLEASLGEE